MYSNSAMYTPVGHYYVYFRYSTVSSIIIKMVPK